VAIKLAITVALTPVVLFVLVPRLDAAAAADQLFAESQRVQLVIAPAVASSLLALNVALAVYKPHWRLRRSLPLSGIARMTASGYGRAHGT